MNRCILVTLIAINILSCNKPHECINQFADSVYVSIYELQDRRDSERLLKYLDAADDKQRAYAAVAFASVQDSSAVKNLGRLLSGDKDTDVRKAAAFAIGQTRCQLSASILFDASGNEKNPLVLAEIVEGYGKVTRRWNLELSTLDTIINEGLAWSIYRAGVNGLADSALNEKAIQLLSSPSRSVRMGAAYYFARSAKGIDKYEDVITKTALSDASDNVRMAAALALRKISSREVARALNVIMTDDRSSLVRINAVRALGSFPLAVSMPGLLHAVRFGDLNAAIQASETLRSYDTSGMSKEFLPLIKIARNWRVQANLYYMALKGSYDNALQSAIESAYKSSTNPYQKAALLEALSATTSSFEFIRSELFSNSNLVIKTAAATAIVAMNRSKDFHNKLKTAFADVYIKGISTADVGLVSILGGALADPRLDYKKVVKDTSFLYTTKRSLTLPKDNEALQGLEAVIAYFEGKPVVEPINAFNHPIDWKKVAEIPSSKKAIISTDKGDIVIRFLIDEAPGSVVNFVSLAESKYFDGKNFHRVVPNFVAQGGCNRGDGFGGEDYSIRSEFSPRKYTTGSIGMASAGKDTEGTQWFITHSPTPHLDGGYTIFATVESGMDVVHKIEIGDKIIAITFPK
ncbi:MAG: peptidylprolyl isomerase [Chryseolinea sp.]